MTIPLARHNSQIGGGATLGRTGSGILLALCLVALCGATNNALLGAFLPIVASDLHATVPLLGQIATLVSLLSVPLGLMVGPLADQYGYRPTIVVGIAVLLVSALGSALAGGYMALLFARLIGALGAAIVGGIPLAIASSVFAGAARRKAMSWTVAALSGGPIIGVPLLAALGATYSWRTAFVVLAVIWLGLWGAVARLLPPLPGAGGTFSPQAAMFGAYKPLLRHGATLALFVATVCRAVGWLGTMLYLGAFFAERHHLDTRQVGAAYMLGGVGYVAGSLLVGGVLGRLPTRRLGAASTVLLALCLAVTFALPIGTIVALALITLAAVVGAIGWVCLTAALTAEVATGHATILVLNNAFLALGTALGSALGGVLLATGGYRAFGIGLSLFVLVSAGLLLWPARHTGPVVPAPDPVNGTVAS